MLMPMSRTERREYITPLTNRQLLKGYRIAKSLFIDIQPFTKRSPYLYLGESAIIQLINADREIEECERELKNRGYVISKIKL